jgi:uncharacterized iron-regulated membrane protein
MSTLSMQDRPAANAAATPTRGYRTLWRWHFYAGLFVMPLLIVLAITGTLYCFQPQIEPLLYPGRLVVTPEDRPRMSEDDLLAHAYAAMPADAVATSARIDTDPARSAEFVFRLASGEHESAYLNPYSGAILGTLSVEHRFMQVDRMLHRKLLLGKPGELVMELAACWTLVMIGTGVALWWPAAGTRARDALLPRTTLRGRPLWKSVHAALGLWLAAGALAFVLTGLPWTGAWGKQFKALATSVNLGAPPDAWGGASLRSRLPGGGGAHEHEQVQVHGHAHGQAAHADDTMPGMTMDDLPLRNVPWAVGAMSVPHSPDTAAAGRASLSSVVGRMRALGVTSGYDVALPTAPDGVYAVSYFPADPQAERTVYLDRYSGDVLKDIRYRDYGAISRAVSYGTSLHMGRYFGLANQLVCAAISLGLAAMAVTGFVMWWKRRPSRSLGAPRRERAAPPMRAWKAGLIALGLVFPLMGGSLVAVWLVDGLLFGRAAPVRAGGRMR